MSGPSRSALCACRPPRQPLCLLGPSTSSQGPPHGNRPPPRPAKPLGGRSRPLWRGGTRRPPPQASKAVLEDEGSCFFGLAEESGVDLRRVALGKGKHGGRGVFAAIDLSRGSPVMEVPHRLMLRASTIQAAPPSAISHTRGHESLAALLLACRLTGEGRGDRCLLEGWLLSERAVKLPACLPEVWELYSRRLIPPCEEQTSLVFFEEDELKELQDPGLEHFVKQNYASGDLPSFGLEDLSMSRWALGSVHSRVFSSSDSQDVVLVPFADMLNHSEDSNCCFRTNLSDVPTTVGVGAPPSPGHFQVLAERDIARGEELTITYGATKKSWEMMLSYGFVPDGGNAADRAELSWGRTPPISRARLFEAVLQARYCGSLSTSRVAAAAGSLPSSDVAISDCDEQSAAEGLLRVVLGLPDWL